jgi:transposase-like protein
MICPRCNSESVDLLVKSPVENAWEVYLCETCKFTWRNTEGLNITDPEKYDKRFKLNPETFEKFDRIPPIPDLLKK